MSARPLSNLKGINRESVGTFCFASLNNRVGKSLEPFFSSSILDQIYLLLSFMMSSV